MAESHLEDYRLSDVSSQCIVVYDYSYLIMLSKSKLVACVVF